MFDIETMKHLSWVMLQAVHEKEIHGFYVAYDQVQAAITVSLVCHCGRVFSSSGDGLRAFEAVSELFNVHKESLPEDNNDMN